MECQCLYNFTNFYAFNYKMIQKTEDNEMHRQSLVKNTFRQLLNRLQARKSSPPRQTHSKIIKQKSQEYQKCRKYSAGFKYRPKNNITNEPNRYQIPLVSSTNTPTNFNQARFSNSLSKKGLNSDRCKTQATNTLHSKTKKVNQYSSMLVAKSFILEEFQPRRTQMNAFIKTSNVQEFNVRQHRQTCLEHFREKKRGKKQQQRMFNFRKTIKRLEQKSQQQPKNDLILQYQPWQTDYNNDIF